MLGLCLARDFSIRERTNLGSVRCEMQVFKKTVEDVRARILPRVLTSLFSNLSYWLLYRFRKYLNSWLVVQNLKIATSRGFIFPEAFRLTLVKGIVRIKNVELRPLLKARKEKREIVSDWTKSVDQSKSEALVRDFRVDKLLLPAQDWLRNFNVSGF